MDVQVRIDEDGALRNLRYAFTDRITLVSELLQNARRAQARHIVVEQDAAAHRLSVSDDGTGIDDFGKLLHLHASGWEDAIQEQERPFGVGFAKCLFAARRCTVRSRHLRVDIDTAAALQRQPCTVVATDYPVQGTVVELEGVDLPDLACRMATLCQGFPVDVRFNGQALARRHARERLVYEETPIGAVHLVGRHDGRATRDTVVFLQGFCVKAPIAFDAERVNVVHLDPRQFIARLPDRDTLIDAEQQLERVDAQLRQCWRQVLETERQRMPAQQFVAMYYGAMRCWKQLDLLNAMDELPAELFERIGGYPVQGNLFDRGFVDQVAVAPRRDAIEDGTVRLVALEPVHARNAAHWMLVRQQRWLVVRQYALHAEHWLHRHIRTLDAQDAVVEPLNLQSLVWFEGRMARANVMLCRAVCIRVGQDCAEVADAGVVHNGSLLIPAGECTGEPVRQLCDFRDALDQRQDHDMQADRDALAELIRHLRSTDAAATLAALLGELRLGRLALLHGKSFEVCVGTGVHAGCSVELIQCTPVEAAEPAHGAGDGHAEP